MKRLILTESDEIRWKAADHLASKTIEQIEAELLVLEQSKDHDPTTVEYRALASARSIYRNSGHNDIWWAYSRFLNGGGSYPGKTTHE